MKTGMEYPLIGLVVLVALAILWIIYSGTQLDAAVAATNAAATGTALPAPVMIGGQWVVNAIVSTLIGGAGTAGAAGLFFWVRKQFKGQSAKKDWTPGPNANWGQRGPKPPSEADLYRMMLMQQMTGGAPAGRPAPSRMAEVDDEPTISF